MSSSCTTIQVRIIERGEKNIHDDYVMLLHIYICTAVHTYIQYSYEYTKYDAFFYL